MVVLGVFGEHPSEERELCRWKRVDMGHEGLPVLPNLVVLEVLEGYNVEPV